MFVTLTYDDEHVYINEKGVPSVNKRDMQLFMKRLRKLYPKKLRYFVTAEYGDTTHRPHYHGLFFFSCPRTPRIYDDIQNAWQNGFCQFGEIETGSITYCTKYCLKKTAPPPDADKVFRLFSSRPGLGASYMTPQMTLYHYNHPEQVHIDGETARLPRYYRKRLEFDEYEVFDKQDTLEREMYESFNKGFAAFQKAHPDWSLEKQQVLYMRQERERKRRESELINKHSKNQYM